MASGKRKVQRLCYLSDCECGELVEWHWLGKWKCLCYVSECECGALVEWHWLGKYSVCVIWVNVSVERWWNDTDWENGCVCVMWVTVSVERWWNDTDWEYTVSVLFEWLWVWSVGGMTLTGKMEVPLFPPHFQYNAASYLEYRWITFC
jgi:hypothetical protein